MRTIHKKWIVIGAVAAIFLTSRIYDVTRWLERYDLICNAREFESVYLTGTTIVVIVVLLFLLKNNGNGNGNDHRFPPHHRRDRRDV